MCEWPGCRQTNAGDAVQKRSLHEAFAIDSTALQNGGGGRRWIIVMNYDKTYVHSFPFLPIYTARLRPVVMAEHCVCGAGGVVR